MSNWFEQREWLKLITLGVCPPEARAVIRYAEFLKREGHHKQSEIVYTTYAKDHASDLERLKRIAFNALPTHGRREFDNLVSFYIEFYGQQWNQWKEYSREWYLGIEGVGAHAVAAAFAKVVSAHYSTLASDHRVRPKRADRASAEAKRVRSSMRCTPLTTRL
jgi:hypothetical protein